MRKNLLMIGSWWKYANHQELAKTTKWIKEHSLEDCVNFGKTNLYWPPTVDYVARVLYPENSKWTDSQIETAKIWFDSMIKSCERFKDIND